MKLIHGWIPTYGHLCRQGRAQGSICPRCSSTVETTVHVSIRPAPSAVANRMTHLNTFLRELLQIGTPLTIGSLFEYNFTNPIHIISPIDQVLNQGSSNHAVDSH